MKVLFADAARAESLEAFDYYQQRSAQAARRFLEQLESACAWLAEHPTTGRPLSSRTRRYLMKVFPYIVVYRIQQEAIWIIGVVHEKRDPKSWRHLI